MVGNDTGRRRSASRPPASLLGGALIVALVVLLGGSAVEAHASVISIDPASGTTLAEAPPTVVVEFDEPIALSGDDSVVLDDEGTPVSISVEAIDRTVRYELGDGLDDGTYIVVWAAISLDSHRITGSSTFHVGRATTADVDLPTGSTAPGAGVVRALASAVLLGATLIGIGAAWFGRRWRSVTDGALDPVVVRWCGVGLAAVAIVIPIRAAELAGQWAALLDLDPIIDALDGPVGLGSALLATGLLVTIVTVRAGLAGVVWSALGAALVVAGLVVEGHTRSATPRWLVIGSDAVHIVAAAVWAGGVVALLHAWRRFSDGAGRRRAARDLSAHAIWAVAGVAAAGVAMALSIAPGLDAFWSTRWGVAILVKIGLVAALVGLGWLNRSRIGPGPRSEQIDLDLAADATLRRSLRLEAALFAAVFVATGVVVGSSPTTSAPADAASAEPAAAAPVHEVVELSSGAGTVRFDLEPGRTGANELLLTLADPAGAALNPEQLPTVELSSPDRGVEGIDLPVHALGVGVYHLYVDLPISGRWVITADVRTGTFDTGRAQVAIDVG